MRRGVGLGGGARPGVAAVCGVGGDQHARAARVGSRQVTVTGVVRYQPVEHAAPLHEIAVTGAVLSICTAWDLTASALPALCVAKNFTVAVLLIAKGAVDTVLVVVGVEPLVV